MINKILTAIFGSQHDRELKRIQPKVDAINALEPQFQALSGEQLRAKTDEFRQRLADGESLEDFLEEAFATVRETSVRTLGMRHYDVQLFGGIILHEGHIAEMKTGEGKTLMSTLPVYLNALTGKGVHVVTVNDYLASRDAAWMGEIFQFLGLTVGVIESGRADNELRREAYAADITYGTNNEFGFDYLRDNMKFQLEAMVQRGHAYAIIDEVDSILVDEARTPLIISGPSDQSVDRYYKVDKIIPKLQRGEEIEEENGDKYTTGDFLVDEKAQTVALTDEGVAHVEKLIGIENLYDPTHMETLHGVNQGLRAHHLFQRDKDYLINNGEVVIVDEFTGRMMEGRRWSDGLHQAVEAKEGVKVKTESQTFATITFQNYFRMYDKLAGMTGTAETEAQEFGEIYKLEVTVIPTNRPMVRDDRPDLVYRTVREKWNAVVEEIREAHEHGQPVLVGTVSIESSETLSKRLKKERIPHVVLNAKFHDREAGIVAQAGRKGAVTIATNMAGRGTDIVLGGNPESLARAEADPEKEPDAYAKALEVYSEECAVAKNEVLEAGGLHILGTERHESRRIDNQLRGRAGRQGDPGSSRFFLSLEDDLMRIFANDTARNLIGKLGLEEGEPIESNMVSKAIERAQTQVETRNFEIRKRLLEYDDVMNRQREEIYRLRRDILEGKEGRDYLLRVSDEVLDYQVETHCPTNRDPQDWALTELATETLSLFDIDIYKEDLELRATTSEQMRDELGNLVHGKYAAKEERHTGEVMRVVERQIMLSIVDQSWKDHLLALDHLKEGIGLRGYGQRDPLNEYKRESFEVFDEMRQRIEDTMIKNLFRVEPVSREEMEERERRRREQIRRALSTGRPGVPGAGGPPQRPQTVRREGAKVGRNDPCPCGSGKKYKKCHGASAPVGAA
ncbi:MAG: preprotein translocase subunit SecA [Acidobacteriota bacterium]